MKPAPRGGGGTIQRHESPTSTLPLAEGPEAERFEEPPPSVGGEPRESGPVAKNCRILAAMRLLSTRRPSTKSVGFGGHPGSRRFPEGLADITPRKSGERLTLTER